MPLSDRNTAQYTIIRVLTVDRNNTRIEGILRDGGKVMVPVRQSGAAFRWPRVNEAWFVQRSGIDWALAGRLRGQTDHPLSDVEDNEVRLDAENITDSSGRKVPVKYVSTLGAITGGVPTSVSHNLNTLDISLTVYSSISGQVEYPETVFQDANTALITFTADFPANTYRVVIIG